ncbi:Lon family ATP-dependent protease [Candidatus Formimonas warabiya]|uniref:endopeptidase La n=1 Tax=Formimonas warabiya TaxID=1761012 RepID=A0A3G1KUX9_FORW1|nr:Lon family ATP-dependent protease [Candidatus Formimonas warabiya]ATW26227.1 ATP-dependent protease, Lon family [Candidatus Formimonas warabiya]
MKGFLDKFIGQKQQVDINNKSEDIEHQVAALYSLVSDIFGSDRVVIKATKLEALPLLRSTDVAEKVLGLQKIVFKDPTLDAVPRREDIPAIIQEIEGELADYIARRSVEERLEKMIADRMQERHEEYMKEIKMQIVKENSGPENAQTLKKLAVLEKMEHTRLARSAMEVLRPRQLEEVVGQEKALKALIAKIACPFPQHVILYGPPGVGKTSAARLALETAQKMKTTSFGSEAKFVEVDGNTLRWDPRDVTNPLLGSVHDPIYQGARKDLADTGIPEPKLGLVTEAHGGVLFIDEIGEMDPMLLNKLLKVLEDKRVQFESSYFDPYDENVPQYIRKLFQDGAPADFVLIGATTRSPGDLNPALRSRCAEVFFEPLTPQDIKKIVMNAADKLEIGFDASVPDIIAEYTIEGRKANNILADAFGLALYRQQVSPDESGGKVFVTKEDVYEVVQISRLVPYVVQKASEQREVGKVFGLGVAGFVGSVLEIEAVTFPSKEGKGQIRFNDTAGSMAKDSVFNASSVFRKVCGEDLSGYDVHVNVVGGGNIDGPSAGVAIFSSIYSAVYQKQLRQDVAVTGELSIQGKVKPVGGVFEKIYGAKQAGMMKVLIPKDNENDIPSGIKGIEVITVSTVEEALEYLLA